MAGLKLPTGKTSVVNADGEVAERTLQPGTGTTDAFLGAFYQVQLPEYGASMFGQGLYAFPLNSYHAYRPGQPVHS